MKNNFKKKTHLNICQVSLRSDIPIILDNYRNFKKLYKYFTIYIVCPTNEVIEFKKKLNFKEFNFLSEDEIISLDEFDYIFRNLNHNINYKDDFKSRLSWYYQQILKITFSINFVQNNNEKIVIWDADTIILKKINFFKNEHSIKYGTFSEFHKEYYITNKAIIGELPKYFISSLIQFIAISKVECDFLLKTLNVSANNRKNFAISIANIILKNIFNNHKVYNGSFFSEYELIGILNYTLNKTRQKSLLTLRSGLNGKLSNLQIFIARILNFKHITYEHTHDNVNSLGMLDRKQNSIKLFKIILKTIFKFYLRDIRHFFKYHFYAKF